MLKTNTELDLVGSIPGSCVLLVLLPPCGPLLVCTYVRTHILMCLFPVQFWSQPERATPGAPQQPKKVACRGVALSCTSAWKARKAFLGTKQQCPHWGESLSKGPPGCSSSVQPAVVCGVQWLQPRER